MPGVRLLRHGRQMTSSFEPIVLTHFAPIWVNALTSSTPPYFLLLIRPTMLPKRHCEDHNEKNVQRSFDS